MNKETVSVKQALTPKQTEAAKNLEDMQDNVAHFAMELREEIKLNTNGEYTIPKHMVKSLDDVLKKWTDASEAFMRSLREPA